MYEAYAWRLEEERRALRMTVLQQRDQLARLEEEIRREDAPQRWKGLRAFLRWAHRQVRGRDD